MDENRHLLRFARRLKRYFYALQGKDFFTLPKKNAEAEGLIRLGSLYGGWVCMADKIDPSSNVYSFGVGKDISFDLELIALRGCKVHAFDPSTESADWIKTQTSNKQLSFYPTDWGTSMEHYPFENRTFGATTPHAQFSLTQEKAKTFPSILLRQLWKN